MKIKKILATSDPASGSVMQREIFLRPDRTSLQTLSFMEGGPKCRTGGSEMLGPISKADSTPDEATRDSSSLMIN